MLDIPDSLGYGAKSPELRVGDQAGSTIRVGVEREASLLAIIAKESTVELA